MLNALREKIFGSKNSKLQAKSRLHLVLVQDRSGLSGDEMGDFRQDLLGVLKKYFMIDDRGLEVSYQRESSSTTLVINSPVLRRKPTVVKDKDSSKDSKDATDKGDTKNSKSKQAANAPAETV